MSKKYKDDGKKIEKSIAYIIMSFLFFVGFFLGILVKVLFPTEYTEQYRQTRSGGYEYINPLVDFESIESAKVGELFALQKELDEYVSNTTEDYNATKVSHISIYYKDLNSGGWIGVNENEKFSPASLLKLPIMIATYKLAEIDPTILTTEVEFRRKEERIYQIVEPEETLIEGQIYTIDTYIERLIKYSDNNAIEPILSSLEYTELANVYKDLGIPNPYETEAEDVMTVKDYASFFRILYNASYLNKDMSTKALKLLAETNYNNGITAGVPSNIKVANKFGERELF